MLRRYAIRLLLAVMVVFAVSSTCAGQFAIQVTFAPPELPVYEQPPCPGEDYIWTPGYWAWDDDGDDYYWVPGTWVLGPEPGYFWTPPYWAWLDSAFVFYPGYWGPEVGFYGGIDYGFGYYGRGYDGGRWEHGHFYYNRYVNNVNVNVVHNVYETRLENRNVNVARVSYNGGNGGVNARPTAQEESIARGRHVGPTSIQAQHMQAARNDTQLRAAENRGKPPIAATARPNEFRGENVVPARAGGNYAPPPNRSSGRGKAAGRPESNAPPNTENNRVNPGNNHPTNAVHPNDLPLREWPTPPNTGNAKQDQKYQQQQEKLYQKQVQERQRLQQQQEKEHQKFQQRQNQARQNQQREQEMQQRQQQMEQRHQQQTQQMYERHQQQQQQMQQRQAPPQERQAPPPAHENPAPHH